MSHQSGRLETALNGTGPSFQVGGSRSLDGTYNDIQANSKLTVNIQGNFAAGASISLKNAAGSVVLGPLNVPQSVTNVTLSAGTYFFQLTGNATGVSAQVTVTG